ncbi:type II toxin-antitoxin system RelE/ParE family toxin [Nocardioides sp. Bht2]|uniref:type II toxin-antitoxin system RelE/ParE family toxin n=1 Tax=Nocardioides sp. Bht2 TaxID=3392297 RepID=UPI0039B437AA
MDQTPEGHSRRCPYPGPHRTTSGCPGDARPVGDGVSELRIDHGPGYRVYYLQQRDIVIVLLCGGDKSSQTSDIRRARALAKEWRNHGIR